MYGLRISSIYLLQEAATGNSLSENTNSEAELAGWKPLNYYLVCDLDKFLKSCLILLNSAFLYITWKNA